MIQLATVFEAFVLYSSSYFVVFAALLFFPRHLLHRPPESRLCPPGFTFIVTLTAAYIAISQIVPLFDHAPRWLTEGFVTGCVFAVYAIAINIWQLVLSYFSSITPQKPVREQLGALTYPAALYLLVSIPGLSVYLTLETSSSDTEEFENLILICAILQPTLGLWGLRNVARHYYEIGMIKSWFVALLALVVSLPIALLTLIAVVSLFDVLRP